MDCHWFKIHHCRSCALLSHSYSETLVLKEKKLLELFSNTSLSLGPTIGLSDQVAFSRNKAKLAAFGTSANVEFGFYDSAMNFKNLESCPLHMPGMNELFLVLKQKVMEFNITPYSLVEKKGELKYVILSKSESHGDFLVRFILRSKESLDRLKKMAKVLSAENPQIKVVTANIQPEHKAILEGEEEMVLSESSNIIHQFGRIFLTLGPRSFFQVTPKIASHLYHTVGELVKREKIKSFLDLYCGVGAFSFFAAEHCPRVLGVELSKEAILCAEESKSLNKNFQNLEFKALDVEDFLKNLSQSYEAILVNPPRRGLSVSIIQNILEKKPRVIIYSSCNAETLARDYESMKADYVITHTQIFDMFPYTEHFETLMVMNRKDA